MRIYYVLAIALLLLSACTQAPTGQVVKEQQKVIVIGAPLSLTGKLASIGEDMKQGIELAVEELNSEQNKYRFVVSYADTKSSSKDAVSVVTKQVNVEGIRYLMGPVASSSVMAAAPITEEAGATIFVVGSAEDISDAGKRIFRNRETAHSHGEKMANELIKKNVRKVALLTADTPNANTYSESFKTGFIAKGGKIVIDETYAPDNTDYRTMILKVKQSDAQGLYAAVAAGTDAGNLFKQALELDLDMILSGSAATGLEEVQDILGEKADGIYFTYPTFDTTKPRIVDFVETYTAKFDEEPAMFAGLHYDSTKMLGKAIIACNNEEECVNEYLYAIEYNGVTGMTSFDEKGDAVKDIALMVYEDGKAVLVE